MYSEAATGHFENVVSTESIVEKAKAYKKWEGDCFVEDVMNWGKH